MGAVFPARMPPVPLVGRLLSVDSPACRIPYMRLVIPSRGFFAQGDNGPVYGTHPEGSGRAERIRFDPSPPLGWVSETGSDLSQTLHLNRRGRKARREPLGISNPRKQKSERGAWKILGDRI